MTRFVCLVLCSVCLCKRTAMVGIGIMRRSPVYTINKLILTTMIYVYLRNTSTQQVHTRIYGSGSFFYQRR